MPMQSFTDYDAEFSSSRRRNESGFLSDSKAIQRERYEHYPGVTPAYNISQYSQSVGYSRDHHRQHHRGQLSSSSATSAATSRSSTANSQNSHPNRGPLTAKEASVTAQGIQPTNDVAVWAHQTHMRQGRSYWWCQGCFPKDIAEPLHIPKAVEKVITGRRVRILEPADAYDM